MISATASPPAILGFLWLLAWVPRVMAMRRRLQSLQRTSWAFRTSWTASWSGRSISWILRPMALTTKFKPIRCWRSWRRALTGRSTWMLSIFPRRTRDKYKIYHSRVVIMAAWIPTTTQEMPVTCQARRRRFSRTMTTRVRRKVLSTSRRIVARRNRSITASQTRATAAQASTETARSNRNIEETSLKGFD